MRQRLKIRTVMNFRQFAFLRAENPDRNRHACAHRSPALAFRTAVDIFNLRRGIGTGVFGHILDVGIFRKFNRPLKAVKLLAVVDI